MIDLEKCLLELANKRPIFHSEADFQHSLAWEIHLQTNLKIRLEYTYRQVLQKDPQIDIVVWEEDKLIPIELKYKTRKFTTIIDGEEFFLKDHSATDQGRYDFIYDIKRVEEITEQTHTEGYCVFLTNVSAFWNKGKLNSIDNQFKFYQRKEILRGELRWQGNPSKKTIENRENPITIRNDYSCNWKDYSSFNMKYLLLKIS